MNRILIIVSIIAISIGIYFAKVNIDLNKKVSDQSLNLKSLEHGVQSYKDKLGKTHSVVIEQNKTLAELKQSQDSIVQKLLKVAKDSKIKPRNITNIGTISTELVHDTTIAVTSRDTTYELSEKCCIFEQITIKNDSLSRHLEVYNEQSLIWHTKKETIGPMRKFPLARWLQKKHRVTYIDVVNSNPFVKTTNQQFIIVNK